MKEKFVLDLLKLLYQLFFFLIDFIQLFRQPRIRKPLLFQLFLYFFQLFRTLIKLAELTLLRRDN
jgi:hypothetical protein